jgi:hypothetical protein
MHPVHTLPTYFFKIHYNIHLRLGLPSGLLPSGFPKKNLYIFLIYTMRATWPDNLVLDLITLTVFGEAYQ